MSLSTLKCRIKAMILSVLIIALAVATFVSVNSAVDASNGYIKRSLLETPLLRTLYVFSEDDYTVEQLEMLKNDERVESVFEFSYGLCVSIDEQMIKEKNATLTPYFSAYDEYIMFGKNAQNENEVVIPYYVEKGGIESTDYEKRDLDLLNKEIVMKYMVYNFYTLEYIEEVEVTCKVVGFYDNASSGRCGDEYLIYDESLAPLIESVDYMPTSEEELVRAAEYMGFEDVETMIEAYEGERVPGELGLCAVSYDATKGLEAEYGLYRYAKVDESVEYEFESFRFIGSVLSFIFIVVALMNIVISTINSINKRQWEFALKYAMGFKHNQIYREIVVEMFIVATMGIILGIFFSNGILYIIRNEYMISKNIMYLTMDIGLQAECIIKGILLSIIPSVAGTIIGILKIRNIKIAETLKNS